MLNVIIISVSAILQFSAAVYAFRLFKSTGRVNSWLLISLALFLMGARRLHVLVHVLFTPGLYPPDMANELTGLVLSVLMFIGIIKFSPLLLRHKETEDKYYNILENMMEGYQVIDRKWKYVYLNNAAAGQGKKNKKDMIGRSMTDVYPGIDKTEMFSLLKRCMDGRTSGHMDNEFYYPDGSNAWFSLNIQPVPEGISIHSIDITKRIQSEKMLTRAQEVASIGSWALDLATGKMSWSDEMFHLFGISREEFDGSAKIAHRKIHPDDLPEVEAIYNNIINDGVPQPAEYRVLIPEGGERIVHAEGNIEYNEKGKPVRLTGYVQDITERKLAEKELLEYREHLEEIIKERTSELEKMNSDLQAEITVRKRVEDELASGRNMLRTLIDSLPDDIYAKDRQSKFIMANRGVLSTFKQNDFAEILGKTDFDFLPGETAEENFNKEQSVLNGNHDAINYEFHYTDSEGIEKWKSITKVPMRSKEGNVTGLVGINKDITEFKNIESRLQKAKEEAESANKAKSIFLSSMSHEIRTPMNTILGFSDLLLQDNELSPEHKQWLKIINESGQHLLELINDILEISRIEAGRVTYSPSNVNLSGLFYGMEAMFRNAAETKELSLDFEYADNLPQYIVTDENKLRQILINLIGNAVKFTEKGGIVVRAGIFPENLKSILTIEIEDTGPGIRKEEMNVLFRMFGQAEAGIKEGGTGLGLAISREHARIMGGDITVSSKFGEGSCFIIKIPAEAGEAPLQTAPDRGRVMGLKPGLPAYKVLIVDDRADNRNLLKEILKPLGFDLKEAGSGEETMTKYGLLNPDIILLDIRMPGIDGYEVIRRIRAGGDSKTCIIAVTASAFLKDRHKALEAGANAHVRKPFKEFELFNCLKSCLGIDFVYEKDN